ncbi:hypothetical protein [Nocardia noduli]|uniref:hypothetical protein n=1 Tax=Nocardia noduli TaxID=2815722 RepID=UPI001C227843|nr:hypothetical protein [Nocardia noduli]
MALEFKRELGLSSIEDVPAAAPDELRAAAWAIDYALEFEDKTGRSRLTLIPRHVIVDEQIPPRVGDVPEEIVIIWIALRNEVKSSAAKARLSHLLFQRGGRDRYEYCKSAVAEYVNSSQSWERDMSAIDDLACAIQLSRAIRDNDSKLAAINLLLDVADVNLNGVEPQFGIVDRALKRATQDPDCPPRVDALLEKAATAWPDASRNDHALKMMLGRVSDADKFAIWSRRVENQLAQAEAAQLNIHRSVHRRQALVIADESGIPGLRDRAAAALQQGREEALEFMSLKTTSIRYDEEYELHRNYFMRGESWREAIYNFASSVPLSGDVEQNKKLINFQNDTHTLRAFFPVELYGEDNLPSLSGVNEEHIFDIELTRQEVKLIALNARPVTDAWLQIPSKFGLPDVREVADFLAEWPGIPANVLSSLVQAIFRSWSGDGEGAAYCLLPRVEEQVRYLVLRADAGVYRLQREKVPGQYPGLGFMLPVLAKHYDLDESRQRSLSALLCHSAGLNLRNRMLHGLSRGTPGAAEAAMIINAMLMIGLLHPRGAASTDAAPDAVNDPSTEPSARSEDGEEEDQEETD